jgi:hypothetical protein
VEPPLEGVAVNVTDAPEQMLVVLAETETEGVTAEDTIIVIMFDDAAWSDAQASDEVIVQLTISPLFNVVVVKPDELVPAFKLFTIH